MAMNGTSLSREEVNELIVKCLTRTATEEEWAALRHWIKESRENKEYFKEIQAGWIVSGKRKVAGQFKAEEAWSEFSEKTFRKKVDFHRIFTRKMPVPVWSIAASWLVILMVGSMTAFYIAGKKRSGNDYTTEVLTPLGSKSQVVLPDGSKLWLNAGSKISYGSDFGKAERKVFLTGEAFFDVVTNPSKPFSVYTSDLVVRAFGTRFNVKAYPDENTVTATLEQGKIDVQLLENLSKSIELQPNENIIYHKNTAQIEKNVLEPSMNLAGQVKPDNIRVEIQKNVKTVLYTSWKEDKWIIESEPLSSLVPKLERRYNIKIIFQDDELKKYKFSGTIRNETAEQILLALRLTAPLDYMIRHDTVRLTINTMLKEKYSRITTNPTK